MHLDHLSQVSNYFMINIFYRQYFDSKNFSVNNHKFDQGIQNSLLDRLRPCPTQEISSLQYTDSIISFKYFLSPVN